MLIFSVNSVLCYFSCFVIRDGIERFFGRNIDKSKVEVRARVKKFLFNAFNYFYIAIWSCMKLEDVLQVLPNFIPKKFLEWFILYGDMNIVPRCSIKFISGPITI
jgi:hypothetical protein